MLSASLNKTFLSLSLSFIFIHTIVRLFCRNYDNVPLVASCEFVNNTVIIASVTVDQVSHKKTSDGEGWTAPNKAVLLQAVQEG